MTNGTDSRIDGRRLGIDNDDIVVPKLVMAEVALNCLGNPLGLFIRIAQLDELDEVFGCRMIFKKRWTCFLRTKERYLHSAAHITAHFAIAPSIAYLLP